MVTARALVTHSKTSQQAQPQEACHVALALVPTAAAVLGVGDRVDALRVTHRVARRAHDAALPVRAAGHSARNWRALGVASVAVVDVRPRIDAARAAGDEWALALKSAFPHVACGGRVSWRHAHGAARTAIRSVPRRVD